LTALNSLCKLAHPAHLNATQLTHHVTAKKTKDKNAETPDLEKSLAELELIVEKLEAGDLTLDESLKQFERGIQLTRHCQTALRKAEQKVDILLRKSGSSDDPNDSAADTEPFDQELDDIDNQP
jgi:exodeoxyribonuclease VII small subunit